MYAILDNINFALVLKTGHHYIKLHRSYCQLFGKDCSLSEFPKGKYVIREELIQQSELCWLPANTVLLARLSLQT